MDTSAAHVHPEPAAAAIRTSGHALAWVIGIGASGLALSALYATTGLGVGCPLKMVTGWDCPLCGGTRMGAALLHADVASAWHFNAFALIGIVIGALVGATLIMERLVGRTGWLAGRMRRITAPLPFAVTGRLLGFAFIGACLGWLLLRNLVLGPLP
ncbi:DUF2752 domain-containing protein [Propionibacteriaceae bacterium Y1685]|uniref:DUF2752 domain-containing protein n=1 Tax=Microlunatus sp. Y1700 TaxID=3418487 RepID=UPI003B7741D3